MAMGGPHDVLARPQRELVADLDGNVHETPQRPPDGRGHRDSWSAATCQAPSAVGANRSDMFHVAYVIVET